jgi:lipid IVA palmitoyltransferase
MINKKICRWTLGTLYCGLFAALPCHAEQTHESDAARTDEASLLERAGNTLKEVADHGRWDILLSGHAYHSRDTYTEKRIRKLNEDAWGLGFGKTFRNDNGNDESLYVLAIKDSNRNVQWSAGYAHQWMYALGSSGLEAGAGISAGLIQRKDWFDGIPFPAVLPMFSVGTTKLKLMGTYVPRISTRKGKGDVLLLFVRYTF